MYKFRLIFTVFLFSFSVSGYSQIKKIAEDLGIYPKAVVEIVSDSTAVSDSLKIEELTEQIQQLKLNEILYQEKLSTYEQSKTLDSLAIIQRKERIDSLRNVTQGAPVVIDGDTLFTIYLARGGNSPTVRANNTKSAINLLGADRNVKPDSINLFKSTGYTQIMYNDRAIFIVSEDDALWMNLSLDSLANNYKTKIIDTVKSLQDKHSLKNLALRIGKFLLVLLALVLVFSGLNYLFRKSKISVKKYLESRSSPIFIRKYKLLDVQQMLKVVFFIMNILRYALMLLALLIAVPMLFLIFPQTEELAKTLFGYILTPAKSILLAIIDYIPNLFTIVIIWIFVRYIIKGLRYISKEIESGKLKIAGFYSDWAVPTFNLIRIFLYIFMIAMIYPYLPGSNSGVFQGISVFVGLIISLGSTAVIGNIVAGLVITYMRPFKVGDMIRLNETIGTVTEKTPFVTRIRTLKNEIVTIPNSFILSSHTTNYTTSANSYGLIIHTSIGVDYDVPNAQVHELLIQAARMTKGVLPDREPFVLDKKFEDFYQQYEINAYIKDANAISRIYSDLHYNIQNTFIEAGIELKVPFVVSQETAPVKD